MAQSRKKKNTNSSNKKTKLIVTSRDKIPKKRSLFLTRLMPKNRKSVKRAGLALLAIIVIAGAIPFPYTFTKSVGVPFITKEEDTVSLERGDSKVLQEGRDGKKIVEVDSILSLWGRLFGLKPSNQREVATTITKKPTDKKIANGTKRYQYMLCSDGSSRRFTDEQFTDENTGFTSKSNDYCAENNQGSKLSLSNTKPSNVKSLSPNRSTVSVQPYSPVAEEIDRQVEKLKWCSERYELLNNEYIGKVHEAQAAQGITDKEFNAIVDPAYWKYSLNTGLLRASGCTITNAYPNFIRQ